MKTEVHATVLLHAGRTVESFPWLAKVTVKCGSRVLSLMQYLLCPCLTFQLGPSIPVANVPSWADFQTGILQMGLPQVSRRIMNSRHPSSWLEVRDHTVQRGTHEGILECESGGSRPSAP